MEKLSREERDALQLKSLEQGKISTRRLFVGNRRGVKNGVVYMVWFMMMREFSLKIAGAGTPSSCMSITTTNLTWRCTTGWASLLSTI